MLDPLSLTVVLPLFGAGSLFLASRLFLKRGIERWRVVASVIALLIAMAVLALVLALRMMEDTTTVILVWRSSLLAESSVRLEVNTWLWPIGLVLSLVTCCLLLTEVGRMGSASPVLAAVSLSLLAGALAALWSANPLTTTISWALYDLLLVLGQILSGGRSQDMARRLAFGGLSVLFLWAGVVSAGDGTGSVQWSLMPPGGVKMTLWTLAGLLRLGAYPFHFSTPRPVTSPSALVTVLLLSPVTGWALWMRLLPVSSAVLTEYTWIGALALSTFVLGGFLGWAVKSADESRSWLGIGVNGAVLVAVLLASWLVGSQSVDADVPLVNVTFGVATWMLGVTVLRLGGDLDTSRVLRREALPRSISSLLGALSLIGFPLTLGFVAGSSLMQGLARAGQWGWRVTFFVGQLFLVSAVIRWLFPAVVLQRFEQDEGISLGRLTYSAALICPSLLLVVGGLAPGLLVASQSRLAPMFLLTRPGLTSWLLWGASSILGGVLGWQDAYLRPRVSLWLDVIQDILRLDWAYTLLVGAFEQGLTVIRAVDDVLGGRGALLWSFIVLLLLLLVWRVS